MPARYEHALTVTDDDLDRQGHVNNVVYIRWMQDAAMAHSAEQGWPLSRYREAGFVWVVRSHYIEYRVPAFAGDAVIVHTWVADMQKVSSRRKFEIRRADGTLLARAETIWAFVRTSDQRLLRIPDEVAGAFELVQDVTGS
jgi:acyl-CoA thioester hydrolase